MDFHSVPCSLAGNQPQAVLPHPEITDRQISLSILNGPCQFLENTNNSQTGGEEIMVDDNIP